MNDKYDYRGYTIAWVDAQSSVVEIIRFGDLISEAINPGAAERIIDGWLEAR